MNRQLQIGLAGIALVIGGLAASGHLIWVGPEKPAQSASAYAALAKVTPTARRDIDYAAFDGRLQRMMTQPSMVGMAVGIVENGRITFVKGYGETRAGSGDKVTPMTVFRWASVSKGVAGTMAAKLAEMGKLNLEAPIAHYSSTLKLPGGREYLATLSDVLSHRLGLYRNAYDDRLEDGQDPRLIRQQLATLAQLCAPG
ncbi:MAG: serine hydrolase domain-containing protein, partial [Sphingomicrobium sp.]